MEMKMMVEQEEKHAPETDGHRTVESDQEGLTGLQELAVAILVVAILVVGGLFAFGAFKGSAQTSVAQQTGVNVLEDGNGTYANDSASYPTATSLVTTLGAAEPGYSFVSGATATTAAKSVSIGVSTGVATTHATAGQQLVIATYQQSGPYCYFIVDNQTATPSGPVNAHVPTAQGTWYGYSKVTGTAGTGTVAACEAADAPTTTGLIETKWDNQW
jgi:hypothetical protein